MTNFYIGKNALDEDVYCASVNGMAIYNPYKSECGRFAVDADYYGMSEADIKALAYLNEVNGFNTEA